MRSTGESLPAGHPGEGLLYPILRSAVSLTDGRGGARLREWDIDTDAIFGSRGIKTEDSVRRRVGD